jgi:uncharacterized protein YgiM (DUF1202 family)
MKSLFFASICIILLAACSVPAAGTATATSTELATSTQVQLPTPTFTQISTPTLAGLKYCIVPNLLNLRSGPGINYSIASIEAQGTCGQVTARNADNSWVYFNTTNQKGWAYFKYLAGEGDISTLPVIAGLTPTP